MLKDIDIAMYFLKKDTDNSLFNKKLIRKNGRDFYEGNARLNKYLHLAQNIYIAKTGKPLMSAEFYAYDNGAVDTYIQENYSILLNLKTNSNVNIPEEEKEFLDKFYEGFKTADLDELIQLSHEDTEWIENNKYYRKENQRMDPMKYVDEYKEQYKDIIKILDRIKL